MTGEFDISLVHDFEWNEKSFDGLVIDSANKRLLHSMAQCNNNIARNDFDDVIPGKGCIMW